MQVVLTDGSVLPCENFKAIDSGVLLTKDKKRKKVIGFVPHREVKYVVPDDFVVDERADDADGENEDRAENEALGSDENAPGSDDGGNADRGLTVEPPGADPEGDSSDDAVAVFDEEDVSGASDLRRLGGLGSTYASRLRDAGYETLADLAAADPVAVAEAASVAPGRGRRWVGAAGRVTAASAGDDASSRGSEGEAMDEERGSGDDVAVEVVTDETAVVGDPDTADDAEVDNAEANDTTLEKREDSKEGADDTTEPTDG
jgi:predicted flap endonuclease-1-like 5' DNA nuclease